MRIPLKKIDLCLLMSEEFPGCAAGAGSSGDDFVPLKKMKEYEHKGC